MKTKKDSKLINKKYKDFSLPKKVKPKQETKDKEKDFNIENLNLENLKIIDKSPKSNKYSSTSILSPKKAKKNLDKLSEDIQFEKSKSGEVNYKELDANISSQLKSALGKYEDEDKNSRDVKSENAIISFFKKIFSKKETDKSNDQEKNNDNLSEDDSNLILEVKNEEEPQIQEEREEVKPDDLILKEETPEVKKNIPAIKVANCTKGFKGFVAVNNASFEVSQGIIHGFLGPNGSGKTTIIKSIIGSIVLTKGVILVGGYRAGTVEAKKLIGYIPESANFPRQMKALEYIVNMARLSGVNQKEAIKISEKILKSLKIWEFRNKRPSSFSSGMKKKILLAQALIHDPKILILDEPAENLDPFTRKILYDDLVDLRNQGKTIFVSSHVLAELNDIVDEATFIKYGHILYSGKIKPLLSERWGEYLIDSSDNQKLAKLLVKRGIPSEKGVSGIKAKIGTDSQVSLLMHDILEQNILLKNFQSHKVNLQDIYNEWIGEAND